MLPGPSLVPMILEMENPTCPCVDSTGRALWDRAWSDFRAAAAAAPGGIAVAAAVSAAAAACYRGQQRC